MLEPRCMPPAFGNTERIRLKSPQITGRYGERIFPTPPPTTMKSIKNLSRMSYETTSFQGWRLALSRKGAAFTKYFPDRKYGDEKKAFAAAEAALAGVKAMLEGARLVDGKHTPTTIRKIEKLLEKA